MGILAGSVAIGNLNGDGDADLVVVNVGVETVSVLLNLGVDGCDEDVCEGDANGDGTVDPLDNGFVLARFGECL